MSIQYEYCMSITCYTHHFRYNDLDKAIDFINGQEKPLAMYVFTTDAVNREKCITSTSSGACDINDCIMHMTNCELPFGGVGMAGMGSYHGKRTFDAFTHHKAVLMKTNYLDVPQRYPPYSTFSVRLLEMLQAARPHWQTNLVVRAAQLLVLWWSYRFLRWTGVLKGALRFLLTMA
jgi:aldehyde dehydrogenase (NAD+)